MKTTKETPVTLYIFRSKTTKEVMAATFNKAAAEALKQVIGTANPCEEHTAKSATTRGMYGKLFGLSGAASQGGKGRMAAYTKQEIKEQMKKVWGARAAVQSNNKKKKAKK